MKGVGWTNLVGLSVAGGVFSRFLLFEEEDATIPLEAFYSGL